MLNNEAIVIRIRRSLQKKQMTQRDLAGALGKKEAEVSRWMSGRVGISEPNLQKIEDILGVALTKESLARETRTLLRVGVIGTGSIANRFVKEAPYVENAYLAAAYNPDPKVTKEFCREYGIPVEAKSAEELIKASDAVYIASPCYTHYEYAKLALSAGCHVLCEIPVTDNAAQTQELYALAQKKGVVFMAALKTAYAPSFSKIIDVAKSGEIGEVVDVTASVTTLLSDEISIGYNNERMRENTYYSLFIVLKLFGSQSEKITAFVRRDNQRLEFLDATMLYNDAVAHIKIGTGVKSEGSMVIAGTKGYIYVPAPWWKPDYFEIRFENPYDNKKLYFPYESSGLRYEIKSFVDKIGMKPTDEPITKEDILRIARFTDKYL